MRHDLTDATFMIPLKLESPDRHANFQIITQFLNQNFNTNIFVYEMGVESLNERGIKEEIPLIPELVEGIDNVTTFFSSGFENGRKINFHRTKYLNHMLNRVKTPIVINYDTDILLDPEHLVEACNEVREKKADLVYPYHIGYSQGKIHDKKGLVETINTWGWTETAFVRHIEIGRYSWERDKEGSAPLWEKSAYGHAQIFNTQSYIAGGGENERFKGWGPEDKERYYRFSGLGYTIKHMNNKIFHLEHQRGADSSTSNPDYKESWLETFKVINLDKTELPNYVQELKKYNATDKS